MNSNSRYTCTCSCKLNEACTHDLHSAGSNTPKPQPMPYGQVTNVRDYRRSFLYSLEGLYLAVGSGCAIIWCTVLVGARWHVCFPQHCASLSKLHDYDGERNLSRTLPEIHYHAVEAELNLIRQVQSAPLSRQCLAKMSAVMLCHWRLSGNVLSGFHLLPYQCFTEINTNKPWPGGMFVVYRLFRISL